MSIKENEDNYFDCDLKAIALLKCWVEGKEGHSTSTAGF